MTLCVSRILSRELPRRKPNSEKRPKLARFHKIKLGKGDLRRTMADPCRCRNSKCNLQEAKEAAEAAEAPEGAQGGEDPDAVTASRNLSHEGLHSSSGELNWDLFEFFEAVEI